MLAVSDDGCGMSREMLDHIFEPFFTTKAVGKGTGLGLSTVYGIVKQNDGFINVYSEPGRGTCIKIYFQQREDAGEEPRHETADGVPNGRGETILLVEDERMILNFARKLLEGMGYRVLTADSPMKALDIMKEDTGRIELVITDMVMPGMNGYELIERISQIRPGIRTILMTGYLSDPTDRPADAVSDFRFLQKPFSKRDLAMKVHEAMVPEKVG